ncbi:DUF3168 domain-containing protein [Thalassococcus sp. S3]|uniref:DUF3168 domain-containing protein n=1 Tax=Thalassococcus sp. S3 TaxID=2017482 RepID=UPI0010246B38|nr:DUF3168 domain-containing protein [Thalassococcus sp. S3]QBF32271.1 hypothetical protein CFI11_13720 [Thalassococcus sp. S3]
MSYAMSQALQEAVYQHLLADAGVSALVGGDVYDAVPAGTVPELYVSLGPETVLDRSDVTGDGAEHRFIVSVITQSAGFGAAKEVAAAVSDALQDADLALSRGTLVSMRFDRATARRTGRAGTIRQIDLRFHARVDDTPTL